jgi:hypothetical protein
VDLQEAFGILGVDSSVTEHEAKQAYRDFAKAWHPDRFQGDARLQAKASDRLRQGIEAHSVIRSWISSGGPQTAAASSESSTEPKPGQEPEPEPKPEPEPEPSQSTAPEPSRTRSTFGPDLWLGAAVIAIVFGIVVGFAQTQLTRTRETGSVRAALEPDALTQLDQRRSGGKRSRSYFNEILAEDARRAAADREAARAAAASVDWDGVDELVSIEYAVRGARDYTDRTGRPSYVLSKPSRYSSYAWTTRPRETWPESWRWIETIER